MKPRILLLDDDSAIGDTVAFALGREGLDVEHVALVARPDAAARRAPPAAALLDVALPDGNGLDLCRRWRADAETRLATLPLLMLTARGEEIDRALDLEAGADDQLPKPFSPRERAARVRALLRRAAMPPVGPTGFELDEQGRRVRFRGRGLPHTRLAYGLLRQRILARGRILSREVLLDRVWGSTAEAADRTVDTHVKTPRVKLRDVHPSADPSITHRGLGCTPADGA